MGDHWGFGKGSCGKGWEPFEQVSIEGRQFELAFGEHPHSRQDNTVYARAIAGHGEPVGFAGHRSPWRIEVQEENYLEESELSGDQVRGTCTGKLYMGAFLVGVARGCSAEQVMLRILALMTTAPEHPVALWNAAARTKIVGRRVYWHGELGQITRFFEDQLEVVIEARTASGKFRYMPWHDTDDDNRSVVVDIYSPSVWWFVNDKEDK